MLTFYFQHYKISMDPAYAVEFLNEAWAQEPVGTLSICIALTGLILTLTLKLFDLWWDLQKERARQGKLKIELNIIRKPGGEPRLAVTLSNTGREPIVVRSLGYARPRLFGAEFIPVELEQSPLPHALNARDLKEIPISAEETDIELLLSRFRVKDSLGKLWEAPDGEVRKVRRQWAQISHMRATLSVVKTGHQAPV